MTRRAPSSRQGPGQRRIAVVTGTRAEYGLLQSTMEAIAAHPRLTLGVVVTGMHLLKRFGYTVRGIERDGWPIDARIPMQRGDDDPLDQAAGLARGVKGIAAVLERSRTDIVVILGDRIEAMAGALAATTTGRFIAHIHGGDVAPGHVDEALRHAITKLAHIHLVASKDAARRVGRLGECPERVHLVGAPGLDRLLTLVRESPPQPKSSTALVLHHAHGRSPAVERRVMASVLRAVHAHRLSGIVVYPNTDPGHSGVIQAIEDAAAKRNGQLRVVRSLDRDDFLRTLIGARVLVGNSSSGIIEAATAGVPSVNIGTRQVGRLRVGRSVIDAGESFTDIRRALGQALAKRPRTSPPTPYGDGRAGRRIADVLARTPLTESLRRKRGFLSPGLFVPQRPRRAQSIV